MGLEITAKCLPPYFERLKEFVVDYRQLDRITFVNTETGQEKTFKINWIRTLDANEKVIVRDLTPEIHWAEERQIYAIGLAEKQTKKGGRRCPAKKT